MTGRIHLSPPHVGEPERTRLLEAFDSNWVTSVGPEIDGFESDVAAELGVRRAVAVSSGTAALHLALRVLGVGPGDVVLVPSFTFVASANAVRYVGAEPVFVDCTDRTWTVDPQLVAEELARRAAVGRPVAAVVTVDLFGQSCDYDPIVDACERYGALLVEDAAEALGATYRGRAAGSFGSVAVLSFNGNKILTAGGGGVLLTDDDRLAEAARHLANQAREPAPHYEHTTVGYNYRMNNLLAAVGRAQLAQLRERVAARRAVNARYRAAFAGVEGITFMPAADYGEPTWWLTCLQVDEDAFGAGPAAVREALAAQDIEARPTWKPMHLQPVYRSAARVGGDVSERLYRRGLCLPSGSSLSEADQSRVVDAVLAAGESRRTSSWASTAAVQ